MKNPRTVIGALALSASALVGIAQWEDYRGEAYTPVKGDVPTIGFGTTSGVKRGDTITPPRALVRLLADADQYASAVKRCAPVPMRQHEFDAYVSLAYNIGPNAFCTSTLARKLNAGDYSGACREIDKWVYFKGRKLSGLVKRRAHERAMCEGLL